MVLPKKFGRELSRTRSGRLTDCIRMNASPPSYMENTGETTGLGLLYVRASAWDR
ncbi:hypothetical protein D3C73_964810 [compost metagenome]